MPEPKEHAEKRNWIERIVLHIPGFAGYLDRENRREADELQRDFLADRLQRSKRSLDEYARALAEAAQIDTLPQVDRLRGQLDTIIGRIRGAMQGYSGFFDLVRIDADVLDRVYEYDVELLDQVDRLAAEIESVAGQTETADKLVPPLLAQVKELQEAWDQREDILKGVD